MIVSDLSDPTVSTEELFLIFYCIIDDLYPEVTPDWVRFRNGADRMEMNDSEVITLSVMQEGQSNDSELSFHRVVQKDYLHLFPDLICRSRYHRVQKFLHSKDLMGIQREMLRLLDGPTPAFGDVAGAGLGAAYHGRVAPLEVGPDVDLGRGGRFCSVEAAVLSRIQASSARVQYGSDLRLCA